MRWVVALRPARTVGVVALGALALLLVLWALVPDHVVPPFVVHLVALFLAVGPAYLMDDEALEVAQTAPRRRSLRLRVTVPVGFAACGVAWLLMLAVLSQASPDAPVGSLTWQVAGVAVGAWAASAVLSRRGVPCPGGVVAAVSVLVAFTELLIGPLRAVVETLTTAPSASWWPVVVVLAALVGVVSCRDVAAPRLSNTS